MTYPAGGICGGAARPAAGAAARGRIGRAARGRTPAVGREGDVGLDDAESGAVLEQVVPVLGRAGRAAAAVGHFQSRI